MLNTAAFILPTLALLLAPGPTNALVALSAAHRRSRLLPVTAAALAGYCAAVVPLALLGAQLVARWPQAPALFKLVGAVWLLVVAAGLWRAPIAATDPQGPSAGSVTTRAVFLTTLTNPKALVVALVLLPAFGDPGFAPRLALFAAAVIASALVWGAFGRLLGAGPGGPRRAGLLGRAAAVWLAMVSAGLASATITA